MKSEWTLLAISLGALPITLCGADVEFRLITLRSITETREINVFRDEMLLGSEPIERLVVSDLLSDGFDENDVIQLFPAGRALRLKPITPRLDSLLNSFRLPPNVEIHDASMRPADFDSLSRERRGGEALGYGLLGGLTERLQRGYRGNQVEGYFRMSPSGVAIRAWNFDSLRVYFPLPPAPRSDTVYVLIPDTINLTSRDTVYVPVVRIDTVMVQRRDTVFIPDRLRNPRGYYYRFALGMLGGTYSETQREVSRGRILLGAGNEWDFGTWDPWISGRQDIHSRVGLRFLAEMAPWKSDTLSPRFLATSAEVMYIPAWDRNLFAFGGVRAYFDDDLFWDRARTAWDDNLYQEPAAQDLSQYELTAKFGFDKLAAFGSGKRLGAWLKLAGWVPDRNHSEYRLEGRNDSTRDSWTWQHRGGSDLEGAVSVRLAESAQLMLSAGQLTIPNLECDYVSLGLDTISSHVRLRVSQVYQTAALRFAIFSRENSRLLLEGGFRNHGLLERIKEGTREPWLDSGFLPYFETGEIDASAQLDIDIVRVELGLRHVIPAGSRDSQQRWHGGLALMFR